MAVPCVLYRCGYSGNRVLYSSAHSIPSKRSDNSGYTKFFLAEPLSSVSSVQDLKAGGCWFDPRLGQYSVRGLMIVIATGFIRLSLLSIISTIVVWESSQWLGKNIIHSTC